MRIARNGTQHREPLGGHWKAIFSEKFYGRRHGVAFPSRMDSVKELSLSTIYSEMLRRRNRVGSTTGAHPMLNFPWYSETPSVVQSVRLSDT